MYKKSAHVYMYEGMQGTKEVLPVTDVCGIAHTGAVKRDLTTQRMAYDG